MIFFGELQVETGFPPDWHRNYLSGEKAPADRHWSRIGDLEFGDVKGIWDANRFSMVYSLARAYARTGDNRLAESFWQLVLDWREHNQPMQGVNWKSGQEVGFRLMAWVFGLYAFLDSPATTAQRVYALAEMVLISPGRLERSLPYELSQRNNHGISTAVGLFTVATLFPELDHSGRSMRRARRLLEREVRRLVYDDGCFSQHSTNYHRVMLDDYTWAVRLAAVSGRPFSQALLRRIERAANLLFQLQDPATGRVPNFGANDGALVLPLSSCEFGDYRPALQAAHYAVTGRLLYEDGPWNEQLLWLCGAEALSRDDQKQQRTDVAASTGGYFGLRLDSDFAFIHAPPAFMHRPSHADLLHVDVWWRGLNIALDPGSYSYADPQAELLAGTRPHNTVSVDGRDQMVRVSRFLWVKWPHCCTRFQGSSEGGAVRCWEGEHDGYLRLDHPVLHRRAVVGLGADHWVILDRLSSDGEHEYRLHWLLPDFQHRLDGERGELGLQTSRGPYVVRVGSPDGPAALSLASADSHSLAGWFSPTYAVRTPALSLSATFAAMNLLIWSVLGPPLQDVEFADNRLRLILPEGIAEIECGTGDGSIVEGIEFAGATSTFLAVS